jgi:hypothetical protein
MTDDYEPDLPFFHRQHARNVHEARQIPLTQENSFINSVRATQSRMRCRSELVKLIDKYSDCLTERLFRTEAHMAWQKYNDNLERQEKAKTKSRFYQEEVAEATAEVAGAVTHV